MVAGGALGGNQGVAAALRARLKGDVAPPAAVGKLLKYWIDEGSLPLS